MVKLALSPLVRRDLGRSPVNQGGIWGLFSVFKHQALLLMHLISLLGQHDPRARASDPVGAGNLPHVGADGGWLGTGVRVFQRAGGCWDHVLRPQEVNGVRDGELPGWRAALCSRVGLAASSQA